MDYIFFAINALAAGIAVLLLAGRFLTVGNSPLRLWHYLGALLVVVGYYSLDSFFLSRNLMLYYLGNTLPVILLVVALVLALRQRTGVGK